MVDDAKSGMKGAVQQPRDSEPRRIDRDVLLITLVLWASNFAILSTRSAALGIDSGPTETLIRLTLNVGGALCTGLAYLAFRRTGFKAVKRFLILLGTFIPVSFLLAVGSELAWLLFTDWYFRQYGITASDVFAGRCAGPQGCGAVAVDVVFTAIALVWIFVAWTALYVSALIAAEVRDRDRRLAVAQAETHQAQLAALRFQLNPHFLFNTLNTLSGLIALDRKSQAEEMLLNLSSFLRRALKDGAEPLIPLKLELEHQRMYLDIEMVRFGHRLDVEFAIDADCPDAAVPPFILQPLVENSIKHAIAPTEHPVCLRIAAHAAGGRLILEVANSRPGTAVDHEREGFGIGIENVRRRLAALFGDDATLQSGPDRSGGWINIIILPLKEQGTDTPRIDRR